MNPFLPLKPLTCILFTTFFVSCVPDGQETDSLKLNYTYIPVRADTWWKTYLSGSKNISDIPYIDHDKNDGRNGFTLNMERSMIHDHIGVGAGDSDFNWELVTNISNKIVEDMFPKEEVNTSDEQDMEEENDERRSVENTAGIAGQDTPELNLARRIVSLVPPFSPSSSSAVTNEQCIRDSQHYLQELDRFSLWALKMHDSSAKLPPGLLQGNVNQYGDLDECLNVRSSWQGRVIKGRYCLATLALRLEVPDRPLLQHIHQLVLSHGMIRSELDDPGHRVPRFSAIHWALCIPASCNASDVQVALRDTLQRHTDGTGITFRVKVRPELCQTKDDKLPLPFTTLLVGAFFLSVVVLTIVATMCDLEWKSLEHKLSTGRKLVQAFSLHKNGMTLFKLSRSPDDIESVHGVRAISALLLLIAHKSMALFYNPYLNRTTMAEALGQQWTAFARGACLHTDSFLLMSGLLTSYSFYRQLEHKKKIDIPQEYISRLMRLVPNLVALILLCTFIMPWMGTGPLWNQVVQTHSNICKDTWWRNLLFIHNYFGFETMCLTHTHHLGIDTQLFALSPLLVYIVWKWPRFGLSTLMGVAAISTSLCYNTTYSKRLTHFVVYGSSVSQLFKTADLSYTLPAHRATVYVMGIALGFVLRNCGKDFKLKKMYLALGWTAAVLCFYVAIVNPARMANPRYVYNPTEAANYAAFGPICWCLLLAWVIFISFIGHGGLLGQFLSWRGFLVTTRLSYAVYLLQFPIFFYTVGTNRVSQVYSVLLLIDAPEFVVIIAGSILLTLLFDLPFQNIRSILLNKPK